MKYKTEDFVSMFGAGGYYETWHAYQNPEKDIVYLYLSPFFNASHTALEIGCGRGKWVSEYLLPKFGKVVAVDVIERPPLLNNTVDYYRIDAENCGLSEIGSETIDFVWCFGVFCHFPVTMRLEYLKSVFRVLKPRGRASIMFPNWENYHYFDGIESPEQYSETPYSPIHWFYGNEKLATQISKEAGFLEPINFLPSFRDTILHLRK